MKTLFLLFAFAFALTLSAQNISSDQLKNYKPRSIGPAGMSGRVTAVDVVLSNTNIWYIGAASGGVWKTENSGASWQPLFDDQPNINIGALAIQQSNPSVVWVGTGEGNPRNSLNLGEGIFKTTNGGRTWKRMGLEKTRNIHRIYIDPTNADVVYAGAIGNPFASHPERGLYKTKDGGATWNLILKTNDSSGVADMKVDPSNPNKFLVNMWEHRRTPWSFKSGGAGSGLYITTDGGRSFKKLGAADGLPAGDLGRIGIAFARSRPNIVYAMVEATKNGLYKSEDGGFSWQLINSDPRWVTNRPFYFQDIEVDPQNENRIYSIHAKVDISEDGGKTFRTWLPYYGIHPDHHAWWIHPNDPNFIIDGNDGGLAYTRDRGENWVFDEKLPFGQFYHINVDNQLPYNVMGGMQDNGTWHGPAYTWIYANTSETSRGEGGPIRNFYWHNIGGGDGFDVMPDPHDANWVYSMSQGGNLGRQNISTGERWFVKPPETDKNVKFRFNWNAAIAQDPIDKNTIYYGSQFVHRSNNKGASWQIISPDLTTNNPEQQKQDESGGLTIDATGAENFNTILVIEPSPKERGVIWVGTDDGNVQLTRDGGRTWTNFRGKIGGMPAGSWVAQIKASHHNAAEAFVVVNDYRRGDFKPYIFRTNDYGRTWTRMGDEKKMNGYALSVIQDAVEPNLIFAGTEHGLYVSLDNGRNFQQWKSGYPNVSTYDMAIQEREADLVIGTFGRAIYILDDIRPLRKMAAEGGKLPSKRVTVYPAPDAYLVNYKPEPGYDWSSWGMYEGENRKRGASISYFIKPTADTARRGDSVQVKIFNDKGEQVRTLRWAADTGFNRNFWRLEEKGFRQPGSPRSRGGEPGGLQVLPGKYKIVIAQGAEADSTFITIYDDPRLNKSTEARVAQRALSQKLRRSTERLIEGMDRLTEMEETAGKIAAQLKGMEGKEFDSLRKATTAITDSIKAIREGISGKPNERQGLTRSSETTPIRNAQLAQQYIFSKSIAPGEQEEALVRNAEEAIAEVLQKINSFQNNQWPRFRQHVENTRIGLFKDYQPIE